jgi:small subunit ribosomal protein S16
MRMGKKKQPFYRVVAADTRSPRNGRFIEIIGTYDPRQDPSVVKIENEKAVSWLRDGAQPTERVEKLLKLSGAWDVFKGLPAGTSGPEPIASPAPEEALAADPAPTEPVPVSAETVVGEGGAS